MIVISYGNSMIICLLTFSFGFAVGMFFAAEEIK